MRRILYGDIVAAASVLRLVEPDARGRFLDLLLYRAHCADKFRKRFGRWCAGLGDGTLAATCVGLPRTSGGFFSDPDYADSMRMVFEGILKWRNFRFACGKTDRGLSGLSTRETES